MIDIPGPLSLGGLPTEIRLRIYMYIFAGAEVHVDHDTISRTNSKKRFYDPVILQVNRKFREEALSVFYQQLTLLLSGNLSAQTAGSLYSRAETIRFPEMFLDRNTIEGVLQIGALRERFPHVKLITFEMKDAWENPRWNLISLCKTWDDVFSVVSGKKDDLFIAGLKAEILELDSKCSNLELGSKCSSLDLCPQKSSGLYRNRCKVIFEYQNLFIRWSNLWLDELRFRYV